MGFPVQLIVVSWTSYGEILGPVLEIWSGTGTADTRRLESSGAFHVICFIARRHESRLDRVGWFIII